MLGCVAAVVTRRRRWALLGLPFAQTVRRTVRTEARLNGPRAAAELLAQHCYAGAANLVVLTASSIRNRRIVL
jgi:hypothetical protein